jgi:hypothetical protein
MVLAWGGLVCFEFVSLRLAYVVIQKPVITHVYSAQSYAKGLRVVGRNGQLSNGQQLPSDWNLIFNSCVFVATLPGLVVYLAMLRWIGVIPPDRVFEMWEQRGAAGTRTIRSVGRRHRRRSDDE